MEHIALAIIGFMVGSELKIEIFKKLNPVRKLRFRG